MEPNNNPSDSEQEIFIMDPAMEEISIDGERHITGPATDEISIDRCYAATRLDI